MIFHEIRFYKINCYSKMLFDSVVVSVIHRFKMYEKVMNKIVVFKIFCYRHVSVYTGSVIGKLDSVFG